MSKKKGNDSRHWLQNSSKMLGRRLACVAAAITGDRTGAEDIVQQSVAIAIEKDQQFVNEQQFCAWLSGIVRHCALNERRKKKRRNTLSVDPTNLSEVPENEGDKSMDVPFSRTTGKLHPLQNQFDDSLKAALVSISPVARCCLLLRTIENLNYKDISELMGIPPGTAMAHVHRSKKQLRKLLAGDASPTLSVPTNKEKKGGQSE